MRLNRIFTALLLCAALLFSMTALAACGGGDGESAETRDPNKAPATLESIYAAVSAVVPGADKLTDAQASTLSGFFGGAKPEDFASYKLAGKAGILGGAILIFIGLQIFIKSFLG